MKIAIPSEAPGGIEAALSPHFGHCDVFTLVDVDTATSTATISLLANQAHEQGGCMAPVMMLKQAGVDILVAGGMGQRPLSGFQQVGIDVYFSEDATTVQQVLDLLSKGAMRRFGPANVCGGGGGGGCGGHDH